MATKKSSIVACAMSGGVDSSVAAALLIEAGYQVIGITMDILFPDPNDNASGTQNLPEPQPGSLLNDTITDAKRVAAKLGIEHHVIDLKERFNTEIVQAFVREYINGRTPNPCTLCNPLIKFDSLAQEAFKLGAEYLATGHYARIEYSPGQDRHLLKRGADHSKDQSYFLYRMSQEQLAKALFPLGDMRKAEVRDKALQLDLPIAQKRESQEICFIQDDDYGALVQKYAPESSTPGPIVDIDGAFLGTHKGIIHYTVGQRRGLGIAWPEPLYVTSINAKENTIVVGARAALYQSELLADATNWIAVEQLIEPLDATAKIRYKSPAAAARILPEGADIVRVHFNEAQMAITPGQSVVFYDGDIVVGGATIRESL